MTADQPTAAQILIVEDEPMIALDVEQMLLDSGFAIMGIAGTLDKALDLVGRGGFDAAIVDANLGGVDAAPVAAALRARGVPFVATSGHSPEQLPAFGAVPFIEKPCRPEQLLEALNSVLPIR